MNFSSVIAVDYSDVHAKSESKRTKANVTEVKQICVPIW